ncbi:MAG: hypothetical protein A2722_02435 [Candidatus Doudnabacteria bacterium RIFCSPHIGHO2_01_FULL_50_11]|uniref:Uncharacterized protein n=1 Tax=Candidatus Doudnabacteria bacterium RIFCSPHIGHO2_01_FULL_50_11 TaxID=1817828 RepID=A0A1F5PFI9_9BACT|nr:MAG: hypothetical protein A2722_02435 [Candidatus Doudnabacteria bacterium RIFCSPHIGHO2_01_FULL_50_11]HLC44414.1 hypothetical protein [Patescibacteria group bacterium]
MNVTKRNFFFFLLLFLFLGFYSQASAADSTVIETLSGGEITQFIVSMLLVAVIIGVVYNLWKSTRAFGGIIGQGLRQIGFGILFLVIEALDRVSVHFSNTGLVAGFAPQGYEGLVHDLLFLLGLLFVSLGFIKFSKALKS